MSEEEKSESRLSRWSRRKRAAANGELADETVAIEPSTDAANPEISEEREAELTANREAAEAVDIATLNDETDFSVFMKDGVPELLKKRAMAALWRANPVFANIDGLVDYDDDFANPDLNMKKFISAYQIGKGYFFEEKDEVEEEQEPLVADVEADEEIEQDVEGEADCTENEADVEPETMADAELADEQMYEEVPPSPRVSLRRRLELET